jgi:hypothetical protein
MASGFARDANTTKLQEADYQCNGEDDSDGGKNLWLKKKKSWRRSEIPVRGNRGK